MKLDKISIDGKKDSIEVLDKIFSSIINHKLVISFLYKTIAMSEIKPRYISPTWFKL